MDCRAQIKSCALGWALGKTQRLDDVPAFSDSPPFGANCLSASPRPFMRGIRLFEFVGYDAF
jgi:hypothetical protein